MDTAGEHDHKRAREVCAGLEEGEVVVFAKADVDFEHLHDLAARGVQWVTRAKDNFRYRAVRNLSLKKGGKVEKDQIVRLSGAKFQHGQGWTLRRVEASVKRGGEERLMVFITNNADWSAGSVCDLYRARWEIEVFFKQVKQTLKLGDFLGHSANGSPMTGLPSPLRLLGGWGWKERKVSWLKIESCAGGRRRSLRSSQSIHSSVEASNDRGAKGCRKVNTK